MERPNSAEIKDTLSPNQFQGITEDLSFSNFIRIRGIKHDGGLGAEQTDGTPFTILPHLKSICEAGTYHSIDPTFQNSRRLPPPIGMDDDDSVGRAEFVTIRLNRCGDLTSSGNLLRGKDRVKARRIEILKDCVVSAHRQFASYRLRNRMIKTTTVRMSENDQNLHRFDLCQWA